MAGWQPNSYAYMQIDGESAGHRYLSMATPSSGNSTETTASAPAYKGTVLYVEIGNNGAAWFTPFK